MISNEMVTLLMQKGGLSKTQATSAAAQTVVEMFLQKEGHDILIAEAQAQVSELSRQNAELARQFRDLQCNIMQQAGVLEAIAEAQQEYGSVKSERAKDALSLYGALLTVNKKNGISGEIGARNAGYITYAFLDGQAGAVWEAEKRFAEE